MLSFSGLIVAALSAGATAIGKELATTAVKDGYSKLKSLLAKRSATLDVLIDTVAEDPNSEPEQAVLAKKLDQAELDKDTDVHDALRSLAQAIEELKEVDGSEALFDFETINVAGNFELKDITTDGSVFQAKTADIGGDFKAEGITQKK